MLLKSNVLLLTMENDSQLGTRQGRTRIPSQGARDKREKKKSNQINIHMVLHLRVRPKTIFHSVTKVSSSKSMSGFEVEGKKKNYLKQNGGWRLQRLTLEVEWVDKAGRQRRLEVRDLQVSLCLTRLIGQWAWVNGSEVSLAWWTTVVVAVAWMAAACLAESLTSLSSLFSRSFTLDESYLLLSFFLGKFH